MEPSPRPGLPAVECPSRMLAVTFCMPGPLSIAITSTPTVPPAGSGLTSSLAARAVLDQIGGGLGDDEAEAVGDGVVDRQAARERHGFASRLRDLAAFLDARLCTVIASA